MLGKGYFKTLYCSGPEEAVKALDAEASTCLLERARGLGYLLADRAGEAVGVVGLAQRSYHLALHELPTAMAPCPVHPLVVQGTQIVPVLYEEASLGQVAAAHCREASL